MKILYIEDDINIIKYIETFLDKKYFIVENAIDGEIGLSKASMNNYDLIIIDFNIPKINGLDICKKLREINNNTPIIFLTASKDQEILLNAFSNGADDFMKKPFYKEELLARINSVINRSKTKTNYNIIKYNDFRIDLNNKMFYYKNDFINLSKKEFCIIQILFLNINKIVDKNELFDKVWDGNDVSFTNVVESLIRNIKNKLKQFTNIELIKNRRGMGYYIGDEIN